MNFKERNSKEMKAPKRSFFSPAQIESIRKSEEEMKKKEIQKIVNLLTLVASKNSRLKANSS